MSSASSAILHADVSAPVLSPLFSAIIAILPLRPHPHALFTHRCHYYAVHILPDARYTFCYDVSFAIIAIFSLLVLLLPVSLSPYFLYFVSFSPFEPFAVHRRRRFSFDTPDAAAISPFRCRSHHDYEGALRRFRRRRSPLIRHFLRRWPITLSAAPLPPYDFRASCRYAFRHYYAFRCC